jgi:SAM-dependent methyltransferase
MQGNTARALVPVAALDSSIASASSLYQLPKLYDVAFSDRDIPAEVHVITEWFLALTKGGSLGSVLELAAGPAGHALEYARRGVRATALDSSPEMVEYASMKARESRLQLRTAHADMIEFSLSDRFDLALLMQDSACHILTAKDMVRHLQCVAAHLNPGGIYVLELARPLVKGQLRSSANRSVNQWSASHHGIEVEIQWGSEDDAYDPRKGIVATSVTLIARLEGRSLNVQDTINTKIWSQYAIEKAIAESNVFSIARRHGSFSPGSLASDATAWRLIYVLRKLELPTGGGFDNL